MKIHAFLKEDYIFLDLEPGEKRDVLEKFVTALKKRGLITKEKVILEELLKRERLGSTGLEKGIAVPHALIGNIDEPILALALIKDGVNFESVDQMPTYIILLLLGSKDNPGFQLRLLAHICRMVKETDFVEKSKKAESSHDIWSLLKEEEEKIE
ncbi:MAG: PTS sugar transporter subunit IIA [Candidatus Aminicenantes bacterium]|nr:PTS sugar transporter subunit IIA [Candidatus Aminicenantes bacterium]